MGSSQLWERGPAKVALVLLNRTEASPIQFELYNYILISTNQSRSILTNQESGFQTNQSARIWNPHLHENRPIREGSGDFSVYKLWRLQQRWWFWLDE